MRDDDHDDDDGSEPGEDDDRLLVDVPLPDYVAALEPTPTLAKLAAAYHMTEAKDARNERLRSKIDEDWYKIMHGRMTIARMSWQHFAAKRAAAGSRSDGAEVMRQFDAFGKDQCGVEKAQWRKYLRLSKFQGKIHPRTLKMQADQKAAGKKVTFPTLNTLNNEWFPADPDATELRQVKKQAQLDAEESFRNQKAEERNQQYKDAIDDAIAAKQALDRERHERWEAEAALRNQIAELTAQRATPAAGEQTTIQADESITPKQEDKQPRDEQITELPTLRAQLAERDDQIRQLTARLAEVEARLAAPQEPETPPEPPREPETALEPSPAEPEAPVGPDTAPEPVDRHKAVFDLLPAPSSVGITPYDLSARLGFDARPVLEDLIAEKRATLQDTTSANPLEWRWTRHPEPDIAEPPVEPETSPLEPPGAMRPMEREAQSAPPIEAQSEQDTAMEPEGSTNGSSNDPETPTEEEQALSWAELDIAGATKLLDMVLTATDLPDLTMAKVEAEEVEMKIMVRRPMKDPAIELAVRRLRLVAIKVARLTGKPDEGVFVRKKKSLAQLLHLPVGRVITECANHIPAVDIDKED